MAIRMTIWMCRGVKYIQLCMRHVKCLAHNSFRSSEIGISILARNVLRERTGSPSDKVTPVPIPNTEVKLISSDDTWTQPGPGKVARCRTENLTRNRGVLCLWSLDGVGGIQ